MLVAGHVCALQAANQLQQLSAFVAAHTEAQKVVDEHLVRLHSANPGTDDSIKLPQHKQAAQQVLQESKDEVAAALTYAHEVCVQLLCSHSSDVVLQSHDKHVDTIIQHVQQHKVCAEVMTVTTPLVM